MCVRMNRLQDYMVVLVLVCFCPTGAFPQSGFDLGGRRTRRDVPCRDNLEYPNGNICCLNCPAGKHVKSPCSTEGRKGQCEECEYGTFTEHSNGLRQCFRCTPCRSDQEVERECTSTNNFECRCKSGRFCAPDQACEVCKKCSRCGKDEVIARNCTSTSNTVCKKLPTPTSSGSAGWIIPIVVLIIMLSIFGALLYLGIKKYRVQDSARGSPDELKAAADYSDNAEENNGPTRKQSSSSMFRVPVRSKYSAAKEDECKELCESLTSTASNSQNSLTSSPPFPAPLPPVAPVVSMPLNNRPDEPLLKIVPVNGEKSLRSCFEFFEDLDVSYHSRFFRNLGINDNLIKSKESLFYVDRVHDLLNIWLEKEGRDASLIRLLKALLDLDQRRTAETIRMKAIEDGHYVCE